MRDILSSFLSKIGGPESLNDLERREYERMLAACEDAKDITLDKVREYVSNRITEIEKEITNYKNSKKKDLFLKASLRNMLMISSFIEGPEKMRKFMEEYLEKKLKNFN